MAKLNTQDVLRLARLAKLQLTEAEVDQFSQEISAILDYIDQLKGVDVKSFEPTAQVTGLVSSMRKDEIIDYGTSPEDLLKNVPAREKNMIKVKRVL